MVFVVMSDGTVEQAFVEYGDFTIWGKVGSKGGWQYADDAASAMQKVVRMGKAGEKAAGLEVGAPKKAIWILGRVRYPDKIDDILRELIEVKNVKYQYLSTQLQDYIAWATTNGYKMRLVIRAGEGTKLSANLKQLEKLRKIIVDRSI